MFEKITKENWFLFAMKHYNNPKTDGEMEIYDDMKRFKYIKRLFRKYKSKKILKERLIVNHLIVLQNVFGTEATVTLLLYKTEREYHPLLKTFLTYLKYIDDKDLKHIKTNKKVLDILNKEV